MRERERYYRFTRLIVALVSADVLFIVRRHACRFSARRWSACTPSPETERLENARYRRRAHGSGAKKEKSRGTRSPSFTLRMRARVSSPIVFSVRAPCRFARRNRARSRSRMLPPLFLSRVRAERSRHRSRPLRGDVCREAEASASPPFPLPDRTARGAVPDADFSRETSEEYIRAHVKIALTSDRRICRRARRSLCRSVLFLLISKAD